MSLLNLPGQLLNPLIGRAGVFYYFLNGLVILKHFHGRIIGSLQASLLAALSSAFSTAFFMQFFHYFTQGGHPLIIIFKEICTLD